MVKLGSSAIRGFGAAEAVVAICRRRICRNIMYVLAVTENEAGD